VYELDGIVVTATRERTAKIDLAANITVISEAEIKKMPVSTAAEVLQYIPGVYVEFNGGIGSNTSVRIQGSETRHVGVFVDGVPLNLLANPLTDLNYIPVNTIKKIEIYKGAASSAWGSALGGVINVITKDPKMDKPIAGDMRCSYGKANTSKNYGSITGAVDRFSYLFSLTHDQSDGFEDNSEYEQNAAYAKLNYDISRSHRLNMVCSYDKGNNEDPVLNYLEFWDVIKQKRVYQRLLYETHPTNHLTIIIEGRHHQYDSKIEDVFTDHREIFQDYNDEIWGTSARLNYTATPASTLVVGFDGDWGEYEFSDFIQKHETGNWALYANNTITHGSLSANAGIRYDNNRDFGTAVSPSAGLVYRFSDIYPIDGFLIRAQIAKGFSAPPAAWLNDPFVGNPELQPEIASNYQIGSELRIYKFFKCHLNLFRADVLDLIRYDWEREKFFNIDEVRRQGIEGTITAKFDYGFSLSFSGSFVEIEDKQNSQEIKDIPKVQYSVAAGYTYKWMTHTLLGKYTDHNSSFPETKDKRFIFDYRLNARLPWLQQYGNPVLFCSIYNLFNTNYVYRDVWPQPDRWAEAGMGFTF